MKWRARISPNPLIVVAANARAYVRAAAASGRRVIAADVFSDTDTRHAAQRCITLGYANGGFLADEIRSILLPLLSSDVDLVVGSGLETQPELLSELGRAGKLHGNSAEVFQVLKCPETFFSLLQTLRISFPEWSEACPQETDGWLCKQVGGSGGTHIVPAHVSSVGQHYFQRFTPGISVSLLFLANGQDVLAIGFNRQFLAPTHAIPYRYGGAVSQVPLQSFVCDEMLRAARGITRAVGLRGLNSMDCMVDGEDVHVLEVNPRLSATFALYDEANEGGALFEAHLRACAGVLVPAFPPEPSQAHLIYYAPFDFTVPAAMAWPDWVADVPESASICRAEQPLCTVTASATTAEEALALARARTAALTALITNLNQITE